MFATTIAEIFVETGRIEVVLEVGFGDVEAFRNLMPDPIYEKLGHPPRPLGERLDRFTACGARLAFIERSRSMGGSAPMEGGDSRFQDCDALLFEPSEDPGRFPVKVFRIVAPGERSP